MSACVAREASTTETAQKASIEQRGLAVITTPGVLVSLHVALFALLLGRDYMFLGNGTKAWSQRPSRWRSSHRNSSSWS